MYRAEISTVFHQAMRENFFVWMYRAKISTDLQTRDARELFCMNAYGWNFSRFPLGEAGTLLCMNVNSRNFYRFPFLLGPTERCTFWVDYILRTIEIPCGSKSKGKMSPQPYPIQCERKWKHSFLSVTSRRATGITLRILNQMFQFHREMEI